MADKFEVQEEGEWATTTRRGNKIACCDCGLVHRIDFKIKNRGILYRTFRDNRSTGQVRRHMKKKRV